MASSGVNDPSDTYHDALSDDQAPDPRLENGLSGARLENRLSDAGLEGDGWNPIRVLHAQIEGQKRRLLAQDAELMAKEEEIRKWRAEVKDMNVQINKLRQEKEKLLNQILHLERQYAATSLQGGSYLDDSKAATPALLVSAINTVRDVGKKFAREFMEQLKKCPENARLAIEEHILKQVVVVVARSTHKKFQYQAYVNRKLFVGFDNPTFFMSVDDDGDSDGIKDEPPSEFSPMQKSEWRRKNNFRQFQKYDLRKFSVKTLVDDDDDDEEHDSFLLREFCFMKLRETFDELMEDRLFGGQGLQQQQHRDCISKEKKHFYESFCKLAVSVWLVHRLAFAFKSPATTFVVERGSLFDHHKMQSAGPPDDITPNSRVGLVVLPGFQVSQSIIPCEVYLVEQVVETRDTNMSSVE